MDFITLLEVINKRTGETVERAKAIFSFSNCKNADEFARDWGEDVSEYMQFYMLKGRYSETAFSCRLSYAPIVIEGERFRIVGGVV